MLNHILGREAYRRVGDISSTSYTNNIASATYWPKTQEAILKLISPLSELVMIAGFAIIGYAIYEFIQSFAADSYEPRKKSITMFIVGLMMISSKAILEYIIGG